MTTWKPDDTTTPNGRWSINSEQIRGEPRWYWLVGPSWAKPLVEKLGRQNGLGGYKRRDLHALADQLERLHAADVASAPDPPS